MRHNDPSNHIKNYHRHYIIRETLSQSIKVEIAKRKAYTKLKLRESADRVKRGQCALTLQINWSCSKTLKPVSEVADGDNKNQKQNPKRKETTAWQFFI